MRKNGQIRHKFITDRIGFVVFHVKNIHYLFFYFTITFRYFTFNENFNRFILSIDIFENIREKK